MEKKSVHFFLYENKHIFIWTFLISPLKANVTANQTWNKLQWICFNFSVDLSQTVRYANQVNNQNKWTQENFVMRSGFISKLEK